MYLCRQLLITMLFITSFAHAEEVVISSQDDVIHEKARICYSVDKFAYRISRERYRNIPIEQSQFYQMDEYHWLSEQEKTILQSMTNVIYGLPFEQEAEARQKQVEDVTALVTLGCLIGLDK